jgi:hypothetical protein
MEDLPIRTPFTALFIQGGLDHEPMRAGDICDLQQSLYEARSDLPVQFESGRP